MGLGERWFLMLCFTVVMWAYGYAGMWYLYELGVPRLLAAVLLIGTGVPVSRWFGQQLAKMENEE